MSRSLRIGRFATAALAGALGIAALASPASAQRRPSHGTAARPAPAPPQMTVPYPGATVTVDPQLYQLWYQQRFPQGFPQQRRQHDRGVSPGYYPQVQAAYPVYPYYPSVGGGVTDANGRPLYIENDPSNYQGGYGLGTTPDLSGSPYVAGANGTMAVDFGNGDRRTVPSCAAQSAERAPNGQPRTIFYQPSSGGVILREGQHGRVLGMPPADAKVCYTTDGYGRMALDWE